MLTAREMMPVMIPVLAASHVCGDEKSRLWMEDGFMPFLMEPIYTSSVEVAKFSHTVNLVKQITHYDLVDE